MGTKLSIDKSVSELDNILTMNPKFFKKITFENKCPEDIACHLKLWRFIEDPKRRRKVVSEAVSLKAIKTGEFSFKATESYIVLLIYRSNYRNEEVLDSLPKSIWTLVESYSNLTPRGLEVPMATSENLNKINREMMDSFQLKGSTKGGENLEYMIFAWNGKAANPLLKSITLSKSFELENYIKRSEGPFLEVLFSGGVFKNNKLKTGAIWEVTWSQRTRNDEEREEKMRNVKEMVFLFKFLFPKKLDFPSDRHKPFLRQFKGEDPTVKLFNDKERRYSEFESSERSYSNMRVNPATDRPRTNNIPSFNAQETLNSNNGLERMEVMVDLNSNQIRNYENFSDEANSEDYGEEEDEDELRDEVPVMKPNIPSMIGMAPLDLGSIQRNPDSITYEQIAEEEETGVDSGIQESTRKMIKLEHFKYKCSCVIENYMYISGKEVAYNKTILKENGITHILNLAGDLCKEKFPDDFDYKTYYLKDYRLESIEAVFYECMSYLEAIRNSGGRVLVHCEKGVSRSSTICIAYLIWKDKMTYDNAYDVVRRGRGIVSPNPGFMVDLILFYNRLYFPYEELSDNLRPKVFVVGWHQLEDPGTIVARMLKNFVTETKPLIFDTRSIMIIGDDKEAYIWIGSKADPSYKTQFLERARSYVTILQKYEKFPQTVTEIDQESEPANFWEIFTRGTTRKSITHIYGLNEDWNRWYLTKSQLESISARSQVSEPVYEEAEENGGERPAAFIYPNFLKPVYMMELDDLSMDMLLVLCTRADKNVYIWRGYEFEEEEDYPADEFIDSVIDRFFNSPEDPESIRVSEEQPHNETDDFLNLF